MDPYELALIDWARKYNAYDRLFGDWQQVQEFYLPLLKEVRQTGEIPEWMGVDLLRGWAFYMFRDHDKSCGPMTIFERFPEFELVVDAVRSHPGAEPADLPPAR